MSNTFFNVLSTNAADLKQQLDGGKITSVQIVKEYFAQIDRHEAFLNAFISPAPRDKVIKAAAARDEERKEGKVRSALHGIPIVLKVSLRTQIMRQLYEINSLGIRTVLSLHLNLV